MSKKKENIFRNTETATKVRDIILANTAFCKLYSISSANFNLHVDKEHDELSHGNSVVEISETNLDFVKSMIKSLNLDEKHVNAVKRVQVWLDYNVIVVFVGTVFSAHCSLAKHENTKQFSKLFEQSIDLSYYTEKRAQQNITKKTESRHEFKSVDDFKVFFDMLCELVVTRKTALEQTAEQQTATKQTAQQNSKTKQSKAQQTATKIKSATAEQLAELTKEIIESETKKA